MMDWYVIYTKPKNEIKAASRLKALGFDVYCPTRTEMRQWSDRKKKITVPLFSCYVFIKTDAKNKNKVFEVPGVIGFLSWLGEHAIVKQVEIDAIREWNDAEGTTKVWCEELTVGDRVYIASGAFENQEAIIKETGRNQLKLLLPNLGFAVCVTGKIRLEKV
jgi:transcription antitermination factor NusG